MEEKSSDTLEKIQQAALEEFSEKGFLGASLRQIVKNAGVTTGAFYGYFSSKVALFASLVEPHAAALMGRVMEAQTGFAGLPEDVLPGGHILIDDGLIEMVVESTTDTDVVCTVINGGTISSHKGINVPGVTLSMPFISPKVEADIAFAVEEGFDIIAAT